MNRKGDERRTFGERRRDDRRSDANVVPDARGVPSNFSSGGTLGESGGHSMTGYGYNNASSSDADIRARVYEAIGQHSGVTGARIDVDVTDRTVTLRGRVPHDTVRRAAWDAAWSVAGVRRVDNKVIIE